MINSGCMIQHPNKSGEGIRICLDFGKLLLSTVLKHALNVGVLEYSAHFLDFPTTAAEKANTQPWSATNINQPALPLLLEGQAT